MKVSEGNYYPCVTGEELGLRRLHTLPKNKQVVVKPGLKLKAFLTPKRMLLTTVLQWGIQLIPHQGTDTLKMTFEQEWFRCCLQDRLEMRVTGIEKPDTWILH